MMSHPPPPPRQPVVVLTTERLVLRQMTEDDAEFIRGLVNEPSFLRFVGDRGVRSEADARGYIRNGPTASYAQHGFGLFLVERRIDGVPVGMCGLLKRDSLPQADLGFAFRPAYWGQGYAAESAAAVLAYGEARFGLRRILAITSPDNDASIRVLERLGFAFEGLTALAEGEPEVRLFGWSAVAPGEE